MTNARLQGDAGVTLIEVLITIVIMGIDYWKELIGFLDKMAQRGTISPSDLNLIYATDSIDEAIAHIQSRAVEPFGLRRVARVRRAFPWLGERGLSQ